MSHHQPFLSLERHGFSRKVKQSSELGWVVLSGGPVWGSSQAGTGVGVGLEYVQLDAGEGSLFPLVLFSRRRGRASAVRPDRGRAGNLGESRKDKVREFLHTLSG